MVTVVPSIGPPKTPAENFGAKVHAHQRYYKKDGTLVPSVTTITGLLDKPALGTWHNRLGLQGIDSSKYVDETAEIGTLAHYLIQCELGGEKPELDDYTPAQLERAQYPLRSFQAWLKDHHLRPHYLEKPLVSENHQYGGTIDFGGHINKKRALLDFKTSKKVYPEHRIQVAAYWQLLLEHGHEIDEVWILQIGRQDDEGFGAHLVSRSELEKRWEMFRHLRAFYDLKKALKDR
jgi:hypothetical protein